MSFSPFLTTRLGLFPRSASRNKTPAAGRRFRPMLEALEDRWLPSTLTVTTTADSGAGSLRAEIKAAHSGDSIAFNIPKSDSGYNSSTGAWTITLTSGELLISKNLTIAGQGAGQLTISGSNASRVFEVAKGETVALSGLTISNGKATDGGGIKVNARSTLTVSNCTLSSNRTQDPYSTYGGGIDNYGTLTVTNSILSNNTAGGDGGGIANQASSSLTVTNCTLSNNSAVGMSAAGGGIYNDGTLSVNSSSLLSYNSAAVGGGICNDSAGSLTITNCTLSNNTAFSPNGSGAGGGLNISGTATISGCTLSDNSSVYGGGILDAASGITLSGCTLSGNSATYGGGIYYDGGGTLTLSGCTLSGNTASAEGGGLYIRSNGTVTVENSSSITGNTAPAGSGPDVYNLGTLDADSTSINNLGSDNGNQPILI